MTVKIMIERNFKEIPSEEDIRIINELRIKATEQEGYVSGETLIDTQDNRKLVVLSAWCCLDDWRAWADSEDRRKLEDELIPRMEEPSQIRSFLLGTDWLQDILTEEMCDSPTASWKCVMNYGCGTNDLLTFII
jgi:heme-degrading monooxygenase HmoA